MRPAILLTSGLVALALSSNAQRFTLMPQVGMEKARTAIQYNNLPSFSPLSGQLSPYIGARFNYKMKTGHGAFVSAGTNRSIVSYDFANVESGRDLYSAYTGKYKLNLQAGYQYNSKPIYLNKAAAARSLKQAQEKKQAEKGYSSYKSRCGMYAGRCGSGNNNASNSTPSTVQDKGWYVSVQPSVGAAYIPSVKNSLNTKTTGSQSIYNFEAGNYNYAFVTGVGFELGKNEQRKVTLGINYLKGIGNLNDEVIATGTDAKPTFTRLNSSSSTWSVTAGIPLTLGKKKQVAKQVPPPPPPMQRGHHRYEKYEGKCGRYRSA
jgi:hypothetical protein